jgi:hypothetical protein
MKGIARRSPQRKVFTKFAGGSVHREQTVCVERYEDKYEIRIQFGTVQPGTTQWSREPFYVGSRSPMAVSTRIQVTANNLRAPITLRPKIGIETTQQSLTVANIMAYAKTVVE